VQWQLAWSVKVNIADLLLPAIDIFNIKVVEHFSHEKLVI